MNASMTAVGNVRGDLLVDIKSDGSTVWVHVQAMRGAADITAIEARALAAMLVIAADQIDRAARERRRHERHRFPR